MDVATFASELLDALARADLFERVDLRTEGPIAEGRAYAGDDLFLRLYFNEQTQTIAFALVKDNQERQRVWGIDRDNRRGRHLHPLQDPSDHMTIEPMSVTAVVARLQRALREHSS